MKRYDYYKDSTTGCECCLIEDKNGDYHLHDECQAEQKEKWEKFEAWCIKEAESGDCAIEINKLTDKIDTILKEG